MQGNYEIVENHGKEPNIDNVGENNDPKGIRRWYGLRTSDHHISLHGCYIVWVMKWDKEKEGSEELTRRETRPLALEVSIMITWFWKDCIHDFSINDIFGATKWYMWLSITVDKLTIRSSDYMFFFHLNHYL